MGYPKEYTNIYIRYAKYREMSLLLFNSQNNNALLFDGFEFCFMLSAYFNRSSFVELYYSCNSSDKSFIVESIRNEYDVSFLKFSNGDIFHMFFMMDSVDSKQYLAIYKFNEKNYDWVLSKFNSKAESNMEEFAGLQAEKWFDRKRN